MQEKIFRKKFPLYWRGEYLYNKIQTDVRYIRRGGMPVSLRVSAGPLDCREVSIVPVIASFDTNGHILPLYVRMRGTAYKVVSVWVDRKPGGIEEYHCKIRDGNCLRPLLLCYYKDEEAWTVPDYAIKE